MNDKPKPNQELIDRIQRVLDPTGPLTPAPNLNPVPGSEEEQHRPPPPRPFKKNAAIGKFLGKIAPAGSAIGDHLIKHDHAYDLAGLGVLAAPAAADVISEARKPSGERDKGHMLHGGAELAGLGLLAAPVAAHAFKHASVLDELEKLGYVSDDEAARALASLQDLEQNKPSVAQTLGYAGLGAVATPAFHMVGNAVRGKPILGDASELANLAGKARMVHQARDAASQALKGGIGGTAVSIGQQQLDRHHNVGKIKKYVGQYNEEKTGAEANAIPPSSIGGKVYTFPKPPKVPALGESKTLHTPTNPTAGAASSVTVAPQKKVAAEKKKKEEESKHPHLKKWLGGMAGAVAGAGVQQAAVGAVQNSLYEHDGPLFNKVLANKPSNVKFIDDAFETPLGRFGGGGPHFSAGRTGPLSKIHPMMDHDAYVTSANSRNPAILAHELGHVDIANNRVGRALQNPITTTLGSNAMPLGALSGSLTGLSDNKRVQQAGLAAPAALAIPQLLYEAGASIQGLRRMRGAGANTQQMLHGAKTLLPAFGTYAANAGLGTATAAMHQGMVGGARSLRRSLLGGRKEKSDAPVDA